MANIIPSETEVIVALVFTLFSVMLLYVIVTKSSRKQLIVLPPGPTRWPVVGCLPQMLWNKPVFRWIHLFMEEKGIEIACFRFGKVHVFPVTSPTIAKLILKKQDAIFASRPEIMATRILTGGFKSAGLSPYGDTWTKMRRVLTSDIFSPSRHRWLHDKRVEEADNLVKYIYHQSKNGGVVDVRVATQHYSGNVVRRLLFNKRYFGLERDDGGPTSMEHEHVDAIYKANKHMFAFCISDYLPNMVGLDLYGYEKMVKEAHQTILKYNQPIIDERIHKWRTANGDAFRVDDHDNPDMMEIQDLLDVFISLKDASGKPLLTREEIIAQTTEIFIAAVDNPATAGEWAMAEMINSPVILKRALEEIDRVVGRDRLVEEQDIPNLNYIKACARESFRLHPVTSFNVPRVALCDTVVQGFNIPKGSHVLLSRMGLGRNPKVWDNPLEYKPERHLSDNCDQHVSLVESELRFMTFSTGQRGCMGIALGTTMTVMLLARMIQGFSWKPHPNHISKINLEETEDGLLLRHPLLASVEPRLPLHLYP